MRMFCLLKIILVIACALVKRPKSPLVFPVHLFQGNNAGIPLRHGGSDFRAHSSAGCVTYFLQNLLVPCWCKAQVDQADGPCHE